MPIRVDGKEAVLVSSGQTWLVQEGPRVWTVVSAFVVTFAYGFAWYCVRRIARRAARREVRRIARGRL